MNDKLVIHPRTPSVQCRQFQANRFSVFGQAEIIEINQDPAIAGVAYVHFPSMEDGSAKSSPQAQTISALRRALPQILAVSVKNVLLFVFGMSLGFPTILIPNLSGGDPDEKIVLGVDAISWIGSVNLLCVPLGCFLSGYVTQPFGRRRSMQFVTVPFLAAWLIFQYATEPWHVFLALCITGFSGGLLEAPTLTYLAEVTTPNLRGVLAATSSVSVIVGILAQFLLGTFLHWRSVALASSVLPIVACALLFFVPESPYWLVMKNRQTDAQKSIAWLRGWLPVDDVLIEYKEFYEQLNKNKTKRESSQGPQSEVSALAKIKENLKLFTKKNFLWPFGLVTLTFGVGHFSGMTPLQTYAVKIFATFNVPINKYYATIILGVAEALGCILSSILVHFVGKRRMNFFSLLGTGCCFFVVATYAQTINVKFLEASHLETKIGPQLEGQSWVPMIFLIGAAFFSHTGIRILPWMLIGEVYYSDIRATASGFSAAASYILGFIANKIFFSMISFLTLPGTFWFYTAVALLGVISLYYWLPETEGKTLFQITEHFSGGEQLDNKVSNFLRLRKLQKKQQALDGGGKGVENAAFDEEPAKRCEVLDLKSILNLYSPMVYSVHPFARIVHLFDHNSLINRFDDLMKECDRIYFLQPMAASQSEIVSSHELRLMKTSHQAIKSYQAELGNTNMSIYDQRFREKIEKASYPRGKAWTRGVQSFLTATELVAKLGDMDTYWLSRNLTACYEMLEEFRILLATVHFGSDMSNVNRDPICSSGIAVLYLRDPVSYRTPGSRNSFCFHGNIPINIHTCFLLAVLYDDREVYQKLLGGFYDQDSYYEASDTASCVSTSSSSLSGESETSDDLIFHKADNDHESAENSLSDTEADKNAVYMIKLFKIAAQRDRIVEIFNFACGAFTNSLDVITEIREQPLITHIKTKITTITESTNSLLDQLRMKIHNKDVAPGESCNTLIGSTSTATEANDTLLCIKIIENEMKECAQALAGLLQWVKYISNKVTKVYDHDTDLRKMNYYYNIVDNYHTIVNIYLDSYSSSTLEEQEHQIPDKLAKVHSNATDESTTRNCLFQNDPYNSDNNADCNAVSEQHAILFFEQMFQLQKITVQLAQNISNGSLVKTFKIPSETISLLATLIEQVKIILGDNYKLDQIFAAQGHVVLTHIARPKEANKTQQPNNVPLKIAQDPHDELNKLKRFLDGLFTKSGTVKPIDSFRETTVTVQVILNHLQLFWETILEKRIQEVKNNGIRIDEKNNEMRLLYFLI
ncbi:hypothetical protein HUJ05_004113 [Dendroctonus ponderosae]|nr:hypothetical protein HUJ05_004113 [Dendroctonus ponderosae]